MMPSTICRFFFLAVLVATTLGVGPQKGGKGKPVELPAEASLTNDPGDRIRPVGGSFYTPGVQCVISRVDSANGMFFLRTTGGACFGSTGEFHAIELDFRDPVEPLPGPCEVDDPFGQSGTLSLCDANVIADVRIIAEDLFRAGAASTRVTLPFNLSPDFRNTAFELDFEQPVEISDGDTHFRQMTAAPGAIAELYSVRRGKKTHLGRFRMPFQLTVAILP